MGNQNLWHPEENRMRVFLDKLKASKIPVVLYGAGDCGMRYHHVLTDAGIPILAYIDDAKAKQGTMAGLPVWSMAEAKEHAEKTDFIILISSYGPSKLYPNLVKAGLSDRWRWSEFYLWEDGLDYVAYFAEHKDEITAAYRLMNDDRSREVFRNLLQYKISRDIRLIEAVNDNGTEAQYFASDIIRYEDDEVFVDLGAYIGDTVKVFEEKMKEHGKRVKGVYAFEPDEKTFRRLQQNTGGYGHVSCINKGAYSENTVLHFASQGFWTSSFSEQGDMEVPVCSLDSEIQGNVTFLKADIEGSEKAAVHGGGTLISCWQPKIAFCVYHKKEDIFTLPLMLAKLNPHYKFYMRHYSELPVESVVYAISE